MKKIYYIILILLSFIFIIPNTYAADGATCYYKINSNLNCYVKVVANNSGVTLTKEGTCTSYVFSNGSLSKGNFKNDSGKWECRSSLAYKYSVVGRESHLSFGYQTNDTYNVSVGLDSSKSKASNTETVTDGMKTCVYNITDTATITLSYNATKLEVESSGVRVSARYFTVKDVHDENGGACPSDIEFKSYNGYIAICLPKHNSNDPGNNCGLINTEGELGRDGVSSTDDQRREEEANNNPGDWGEAGEAGTDSVCSFCYEASNAIRIIGFVILVFKICVPLILIVLGSIDISKAVTGKSDQLSKSVSDLVRRIIIGVIIFFIPTLFSILFRMIDTFGTIESDFQVCSDCLLQPMGDACQSYSPDSCEAVITTVTE